MFQFGRIFAADYYDIDAKMLNITSRHYLLLRTVILCVYVCVCSLDVVEIAKSVTKAF